MACTQYLALQNASCVAVLAPFLWRWRLPSEPRSAGCPHPTPHSEAPTSVSGWHRPAHLWREVGTTTGSRCRGREGGHVCMMPLLNRYLAFQNADGEIGRTDWWIPFIMSQGCSVLWWQIESALREINSYPTIGPNRAFSISIVTVESAYGPEGEVLQIPGRFREGSGGEGVFYSPALTFSPGACPTASSPSPSHPHWWTRPANSDQSVDKK